MLELGAMNDRKQILRMGLTSEVPEEDSDLLQLLCTMLLEKTAPLLDTRQLRFKQHLKQGGYATVYEACWMDKVDVAVKVFSSGDSSFRRELAALVSCKHPNILRIFGQAYDGEKKQHSLIMEKMDMDLADLINKTVEFSILDSIHILMRVAKGMDWLHSRDVIHRDLKPQNILLVKKNGLTDVRIADFGLSRTNFVSSRVSFATPNVGTGIYKAPEVSNSEHYSKKSDVYGFAMICYQLLTGRTPFPAEVVKSGDYTLRISNGMRPLDMFPENHPAELAELTRQCWSGDAEQRPSFAEIHEKLKVVKAKVITDVWNWNDFRKKLLASAGSHSSTNLVSQIRSDIGKTRLDVDNARARSSTAGRKNTTPVQPASTSKLPDDKEELMKLTHKGKMTEAFQKALSLKDPDTLWWLASKCDCSLMRTFDERMLFATAELLSDVFAVDPVRIRDWLVIAIKLLIGHKTQYGSSRLHRLLGKIAQAIHGLMAVTPRDSELAEFLRTNLVKINDWIEKVELNIRVFSRLK